MLLLYFEMSCRPAYAATISAMPLNHFSLLNLVGALHSEHRPDISMVSWHRYIWGSQLSLTNKAGIQIPWPDLLSLSPRPGFLQGCYQWRPWRYHCLGRGDASEDLSQHIIYKGARWPVKRGRSVQIFLWTADYSLLGGHRQRNVCWKLLKEAYRSNFSMLITKVAKNVCANILCSKVT